MNIELFAELNREGAWVITAYLDDDYAGVERYYGYSKSQALSKARAMVKEQGGLGLYANIIRAV